MTGPRPSTTLVCAECGKPLVRGARFCLACGKPAPVDAALAAAVSGDGALTLNDQEKQAKLEQLLIEGTLGEFEILGELGRGGMATVYLAHDLALDRKVAIKVVAPSILKGDGSAERFKREARTAAGLSHPHIIPVHAVRESPNLLFFVMKFVEGRPLDEILRGEQALPLRMVQTILFEVGQALAYAHRRGVVHRDIKPANIMLDGEGFSIVTDFGIAKPMKADALTATGSMIGTPYYMSPEQCGGKPVSGASDQYSLGVVAYQMITGKRPFGGETIMEILKGHFFETPPPILGERPDCPPELATVVDRMLSKEVADRFASMDEALQAMACAPLTSDDPVRTQMIELARSSEKLQAIGRLKVPLSPVPLARSRAALSRSGSNPPHGTPSVELAGTVASPPPTSRVGMLVGGLIVALIAGGGTAALLLRQRSGSPTTPAQSAPSIVDSTSLSVPAPGAPPPAVAESTVAIAPVDSTPPVPEAPRGPDPAALREIQRREIKAYISEVEAYFREAWKDATFEDIDPEDIAAYRPVITPSGGVPDFPEPMSDSRLNGEATKQLASLIATLKPLPRSWGDRPLKIEIRYTVDSVTIHGPL